MLKTFFVSMLVISLLWPLMIVGSGMSAVAHNQYKYRHELLEPGELQTEHESEHLGLTQKELASRDKYTADAYRESVYDGYRLGNAYSSLMVQGLAVSALLFLTSAIGLRAARSRTESSLGD